MIINVTVPTEAAGASLSDAANIGEQEIVGFLYPATWINAGLSFQVSMDGTTFKDLFNGATEFTLGGAVNADRWCGLTDAQAASLRGWTHIKVRSGATAAHVDQTANRTIAIAVRARRG